MGIFSHFKRKKATSELQVGDKVTIDFAIVKQINNLPPYLAILTRELKEGDGKVIIDSVDYQVGTATVSGSPFSKFLGCPSVPIEALKKSSGKVAIEEADEIGASELHLYITNDANLYNQMHVPIMKNLVRKKTKGVYDSELAVKGFMHLVDEGAKRYVGEFGSGNDKWFEIFNKPTRMAVARELVQDFETEHELGNLSHLSHRVQANTYKVNSYQDTTGLWHVELMDETTGATVTTGSGASQGEAYDNAASKTSSQHIDASKIRQAADLLQALSEKL